MMIMHNDDMITFLITFFNIWDVTTPQSNGLVERKNRTLIDMARSMLSEHNVSQSF